MPWRHRASTSWVWEGKEKKGRCFEPELESEKKKSEEWKKSSSLISLTL
jgi:hypothetical protein